MATRILVHCKSHEMPGLHKEKNMLMANIACQAVCGRDYDISKGDRLTTSGGYFLYNQRCDNGPVESLQYTAFQFKWNSSEQKLLPIAGPLHPRILKEFDDRYHFDPEKRPKEVGLTDEEYKEKYGSLKFEELIKAREEKRRIAAQFDLHQSTANGRT